MVAPSRDLHIANCSSVMLAPFRFAPPRWALLRSAPLRLAPLRSASVRPAPLFHRSVPLSHSPSALLKSTSVRLDPLRSAPPGRLRSGRRPPSWRPQGRHPQGEHQPGGCPSDRYGRGLSCISQLVVSWRLAGGGGKEVRCWASWRI